MSSNWLYKEIMGEDPVPARPEIRIPIIDDPLPLKPWKPTAAGERLFQQLDLERTVREIFGDEAGREMVSMMKAAPAGLDNRTLQDDSQVTPPAPFTMPKPVRDPRRRQCFCPCQQCVRQSCASCLGDPKCEFSHLGVMDDIVPVDSETEAEMRAAAASKQLGRLRKARVERHRHGLEPTFEKFRNAIPYGYTPRVIDAVNKVQDAMAEYVTSAVAGEF